MAWFRRVHTASGETAVQIAESVEGRRRIARHVGSATDDATLGLLMAQARELLADDAACVLDLGMVVTPLRHSHRATAADLPATSTTTAR